MTPALVIGLAISLVAMYFWSRWRRLARAEFIRAYRLPPGIFEKLATKRPGLELKDQQLVARALRQFFLAYLNSGCKFVSMPSQVVDDLWHELILYTRHYDRFCKQAFGRFLHHTPAVVLGADRQNNAGLRRVWWYACREENINPRDATRLPLLFAIDRKLGIADGFTYVADCRKLKETQPGTAVNCGGDFSNASFDGSTDGFGDAGVGSGDAGGGCGGGCGGD